MMITMSKLENLIKIKLKITFILQKTLKNAHQLTQTWFTKLICSLRGFDLNLEAQSNFHLFTPAWSS